MKEGRGVTMGRMSHMAITNTPEEMLDSSMNWRFLARVGVKCCVRDIVVF